MNFARELGVGVHICGASAVEQAADGSNLPRTPLPEPHFIAEWQQSRINARRTCALTLSRPESLGSR